MTWLEKLGLGVGALGVVGLGLLADSAYEALATGVDSLDRFPIRGRVLLYSVLGGVPPRAIMALIHNESLGNPDNYLGDLKASGGPSVGPGQVYRATAKALGLWTPPEGATPEEERAAYAELATDEDWGIRATVAVYKQKVKEAGGDLVGALARYNGTPTLPAVKEYQQKALAFVADTWGDIT